MRIYIAYVCFLIILIWSILITFNHPDFTYTRLLIEFWKEYICIFAIGILGLFLYWGHVLK